MPMQSAESVAFAAIRRPSSSPPALRSVRYTVDLTKQQRHFLRLFSLHNDVPATVVLRTLVAALESRLDLAQLVVDTIFADDLPDVIAYPDDTTRYTIDMPGPQHTFMRLFAAHNETKVSFVVRTLIFLLEADENIAQFLIDTIFPEQEQEQEQEHSEIEADDDVLEDISVLLGEEVGIA